MGTTSTSRVTWRSLSLSNKAVGHFKDGRSAHYLAAYHAALEQLAPVAETFDVATSFGRVRIYRFDGPAGRTPVVLLPGRNAATPMWRTNLPSLTAQRAVYSVDLLGEPGLSVQDRPITDAQDQARWLDEALTGISLPRAHLLGASIGGWSAANYAVYRPGRAASLTLLDPVMTFDSIPLKTLIASVAMVSPGVPDAVRNRFLAWISGGGDVDESLPEAVLILAGSADFVLKLPAPKRITERQLNGLDLPVLAFIAGRSVMLHPDRAAETARKTLRHGQIELWPDASHAINGEFPERIAERAHRFWDGL